MSRTDPEYYRNYYRKNREVLLAKAKEKQLLNPRKRLRKISINENGERNYCKYSPGYKNIIRIICGIKNKMKQCQDNDGALSILQQILEYYRNARNKRDFQRFENKTTINWRKFDKLLGIKRTYIKKEDKIKITKKDYNTIQYENAIQKIHLLPDVMFTQEFKENRIKEIKEKYGVA